MTMKKAAPLYGQEEEGRTLEDKVRIIRQTLREHGQAIEEARSIGREHFTFAERVATLTPAGRNVRQLVDSYLASAGLPDTVAERTKALGVFTSMRVTDDVPASDLQVSR